MQAEYERLRAELEAYSRDLAATPFLVGLSKTDLLGPDDEVPTLEAAGALGVLSFSSVARADLQPLLERLWEASRAVVRQERGEEDDEWWAPTE